MGQAGEILDQLSTEMNTTRDLKSITDLYAEDAVLVTPDEGEIVGRQRIADYNRTWLGPFPDLRMESQQRYESGNAVIDEGYTTGTNTGRWTSLSGKDFEATGKQLRLRTCDVVTVENGLIARHHFYFDMLDCVRQLGLLSELAI